jgi:predicted phage terminase large subunit-like protein
MVVSYSVDLAELITRQIRDVMKMEWYHEAFPGTRLARDHTSVSDFGTTKHGAVRAFSIEGGITGFGADYIIVDDPLQIHDADNFQQIDHVNSLFDRVVRTRLNDPEKGRILIVAHRLNEDDLCGHVMKEDDWDHIVLPFQAERAKTLHFGDETWSRKKDELLRESYCKEVRRISAEANYQALYQQNPGAASLPRITPKHFPLYDPSNVPPSFRVLSIDPGEQQGERNSYSVAQIWRLAGTGYFLEDLWRVRLRYDELRSLCKEIIRNFRPSAILIEETGLGMALLADLTRKDWQNLVPMRPRQSKIERLRKHAAVIRSRKIMLPSNAPWRDCYIQEFTSFLNCKYTDQVDATTQFLEYMATDPLLRAPPARAIFGAAFGSNPQSRAAPALNQGAKDPAAPGIIQVAPSSYRKRYFW